MKNRILLIVSFFIFCVGCKVTWVPAYDASIEDQIVSGAKANDLLYMQMMDTPEADRKYAAYSERYLAVKSEINSILMKNQARNNSQDLIASTKDLSTLFEKFRSKHKQDDTISDADIELNELQIAALWKVLLIEERGLKLADSDKNK